LSAAALLKQAERAGVRVTLARSGRIKATGPREALARWLPEFKAARAAIIAAINGNVSPVLPLALASRIETLRSIPCPADEPPAGFERYRAGAIRFGEEWAANALACGWGLDEIFAFAAPFANTAWRGAAWCVGEADVIEVTAVAITLRRSSGSTTRIYRKSLQ
jgi:hypothetical protein